MRFLRAYVGDYWLKNRLPENFEFCKGLLVDSMRGLENGLMAIGFEVKQRDLSSGEGAIDAAVLYPHNPLMIEMWTEISLEARPTENLLSLPILISNEG